MTTRPAPLGALGLLVVLTAGCQRDVGSLLPAAQPTPAQEALAAAESRIAVEDSDASVAAYRAVAAAQRDAVRPHLRYVKAMLSQGRRAELRRQYAALAAAPDATDVERTVAERLSTNGASSALRRVYTAAAERNPRSPWWRLALVEVEAAEADAWNRRRLAAVDRAARDEQQQAFDQARGAARRAQRALQQATEIAPDLAEVRLYRGFLRALEGDLQATAPARDAGYRAAEHAFAAATARDPRLAAGWAGLGDVRFRLGDVRGSMVAWLEAVRLEPANPDHRIALGVVLHEAGRHREAGQQYRNAASLRTHDADPLLRLGDVLADSGNWDAALRAYGQALDRDAKAVEAHYRMGTIYEHLERRGEARAAYARYVEHGGPEASAVERRIERLLRAESR